MLLVRSSIDDHIHEKTVNVIQNELVQLTGSKSRLHGTVGA